MQADRNDPGELKLSPEDERFFSKTRKELRKASTKELMILAKSSSKHPHLIDGLIDQSPSIKRLTSEHDQLRQQVLELADFNYAREPVLNRQRVALQRVMEEVSNLRSHITQNHVRPIMKRLNELEIKLSAQAKRLEEESELMAQQLLDGKLDFDECLEKYLKTRKEASKQRILTDKFCKEKERLLQSAVGTSKAHKQPGLVDNQQDKPPSPMPRTKKRASMNR